MKPLEMKQHSKLMFGLLLFITILSYGQKTAIYTNALKDYNHAVDLYNNRDFEAAKALFNRIKQNFNKDSELRANSEYYIAFSDIQLGNGDQQMKDFVERFPTSTKQNTAFLEVGDYYFKNGKYPYALKWYKNVETRNLSIGQEEDYTFKYGYGLFSLRNYKQSKEYFQRLLNSPEYGSQAKYYYGFIAYQDDDFDNANRYLSQIADDKELGDDVPYYMANIKFKTGEFEEAIKVAKPFLKQADRLQHSEVSKIIGESYFNLKKYGEAIPHLLNYKGKRRRFNNTDYYFLGYAYYQQKDYENAISYFNKIIDGNDGVAQNAYYHLAECYLKTEQKTEALNAFKNASEMDFNNDIRKDAWLNYAKLSYEVGNPYKSVPDVLQEYLETYPKSGAKEEIEALQISAYVTSGDYSGALEALKDRKEANYKEMYQKVALFRGIQLFNEENLEGAKEHFDIAINEPRNPKIAARAKFWKAETDYQLTNYNDALVGFQLFENSNDIADLTESNQLAYNMGYTHFKLKDYNKAGQSFRSYINSNSDDSEKLSDAKVRLGDTYFVASNYNNAIKEYNKVINEKGQAIDYAHFQRAMSYGLIGRNNDKIVDLTKFLAAYRNSSLRDDAYYELGSSYTREGKNEDALDTYDKLIKYHKRSSYVPKALVKQGLIYYNSEQDNQALDKYKRVVKEYPNTEDAKQAVANARQVYVDLGRVDEYADWVKSLDFVEVSDDDLASDMYESAEKQYLQNNRKKAISAFKKYIERYPNGSNAVSANFYLAESLYADKQQGASAEYYQFVADQERNEFTERALTKLAQVYLDTDNWNAAMPVLERLEEQADFPQNITFAQSNLMKGYYEQEQYENAVAYAEKVLKRPKLENRIKSDARIIIARSAFKTGDEYKAQEAYKEVEKIATGELKAEALFYDAYFKNKEGNYKVSNTIVQKLVSDYSAYKYYGAKGLIVMAKNFYELEDAYQATYILESVIKNFKDFDDIVQEAKDELKKIKAKESETNESVNPNEN